jgi:hypothetical protein
MSGCVRYLAFGSDDVAEGLELGDAVRLVLRG